MDRKTSLKVVGVTSVIVMIASVAALYNYTEQNLDTGLLENGKLGFISLNTPSFIQMAGANMVDGGNGASFLDKEAGISAYVNIGHDIDLEKAQDAFKSIETANNTYIIGEIDLRGLPYEVDPHVYVHEDGWILAYYSQHTPASKIMHWYEYTGGVITTTTLEEAIHQVCIAIQFAFSLIKDDIDYYDFEYPNANRMMLIVERTGTHDSTDSFNLTLPVECTYYELSWAHYFDYYKQQLSNHGDSSFHLLWEGLDTTINSFTNVYTGDYYKYGYYTPGQIEPGNLYSVIITQNLQSGSNYYAAYTNVATVLIYYAS